MAYCLIFVWDIMVFSVILDFADIRSVIIGEYWIEIFELNQPRDFVWSFKYFILYNFFWNIYFSVFSKEDNFSIMRHR